MLGVWIGPVHAGNTARQLRKQYCRVSDTMRQIFAQFLILVYFIKKVKTLTILFDA